jgi:uncharacterized membrane protein YeaQ/YmgE (transglycosylase-associated protein family)
VGFISSLVSLVVVGLVIGGLGRLVVPGRNSIGLMATVFIGLLGSFIGTVVGAILGLGLITIVLEVGVAAGLVYLASDRNQRQLMP